MTLKKGLEQSITIEPLFTCLYVFSTFFLFTDIVYYVFGVLFSISKKECLNSGLAAKRLTVTH